MSETKSIAAEWAEKKLRAVDNERVVDSNRPARCPIVYAPNFGSFNWMLTDEGAPLFSNAKTPPGALDVANTKLLIQQAQWILTVFGNRREMIIDANATLDFFVESWRRHMIRAFPAGHRYHSGHHLIDCLAVWTDDAVDELLRLRLDVAALERGPSKGPA